MDDFNTFLATPHNFSPFLNLLNLYYLFRHITMPTYTQEHTFNLIIYFFPLNSLPLSNLFTAISDYFLLDFFFAFPSRSCPQSINIPPTPNHPLYYCHRRLFYLNMKHLLNKIFAVLPINPDPPFSLTSVLFNHSNSFDLP